MEARVWANSGYGQGFAMNGFKYLRASEEPYDQHAGNTNGVYLVYPGATIIAGGGRWSLDGGITFLNPPALPAEPSGYSLAVAAVAAISPFSQGVPWATARAWSKSGDWVRRKSWLDSLMMLRHEAGPGTARAVAMFKSASVTVARAVRNAEFGQAEFVACDWTMKYPPENMEVDLTDASIAVDANGWQLWKSAPSSSDAPADPSTGSGVPTAGGVALPSGGEGFVYLRNGEATLVAAIDFDSDTPWSP